MKWEEIEQQSRTAVVQIFNYRAEYDWMSPYTHKPSDMVTGTGFFISDDGILLSNFHVIESAVSLFIQVPTLGKEKLKVKILGVVPERDITLLQLEPAAQTLLRKHFGKIPYLTLGNSDTVNSANEVLALGYPAGEQILKTTKGVVSGWTDYYLQIDAPLNPGNSGGPALNSEGQVIGINSAIKPQAQNTSYIIPANTAKAVLPSLQKYPFLLLPSLGFRFQPATPELISYLKNPMPGGMYIYQITPHLLFDTAGIKPGDMIYAINKNVVDRFGEMKVPWSADKVNLKMYFNRVPLKTPLRIEGYRKGKPFTKTLRYETTRLPVSPYYPDFELVSYAAVGGLILMNLRLNHVPLITPFRPLFNRFYKEENQVQPHVVIVQVLPGSVTQKTNLFMAGDLLSSIDGLPVKNLQDVKRVLSQRLEQKKSEDVVFRTEENEVAVVDWETLLDHEPILAHQFNIHSTILDILESQK